MRASSARPRAICAPRSRRAASARTSITASMSCRCACRRWPSGATTFPLLVAHFMKRLSAASRPADARDRRRRHGGAAGPWLAGQCPPAAQHRGAAADPGERRCGAGDLRRSSADRSGQRQCAGAAAGRGDLVISLPLREAREIFERDYLVAQINRFGGNISRTAAFIGMERSALHRKLKSLGVGSTGREKVSTLERDRLEWTAAPRRPRSPMSMAAICRMARAGVHIEDRGLQLGDGVYEVCRDRRRPAARRGRASRPAGALACAKSAWRCRWAAPRSSW